MLPDEDKDYVIEVLIEQVAPLEKPRESLTAPFFGTTFPQDLRQGNPRELVMDAVRLCLVDSWKHAPPWLVLLLKAFPLEVADTKIAGILETLRHPPPPPDDLLDSTILSNGAPFVNRTALRLHLRRLATPAANTQPILVVNGTTKSGKSYSTNYIEYFSYIQPPIITYQMEFDPEMGLEMGAEQVARDLVSMMGRSLDAKPPSSTNQKLYVRQLALWVLNEAAQSPSQHWFILDNFRGEKLRQDTRDLLIALSDRITTGVFPQRCRLILIGFDRALLTVDPGKVDEENVGPCPPAAVEASITEILKRAPSPVGADSISPMILANLPNGEGRMAEVNTRLRALLYAIEEVKQILTGVNGVDYKDILLKMLEDLPSGQERMPELQSRLGELRESIAEL
ncbi:MAG: hypothetical protein ACREBG_02485 [Pyrinomonadaceae bacterium]